MRSRRHRVRRRGAVYIAVLGTALIVALLGLSALIGQRIQNRIVAASADICQARLNAQSAVESALLMMKQDSAWRTNRANGDWFTNRNATSGTYSVNVSDPIDSDLANDEDEPFTVLGVGRRGQAEQRVTATFDPRRQPLSCLRAAIAAGDTIDLNSDTLRTGGLISAATVTASSSLIYGDVEALTVSGSTFSGTTTQIPSSQRPTMPDWNSAFEYYRANGTQLSLGNLPTALPNVGRNVSFDVNIDYWTGSATGLPIADINRETDFAGHIACLRVHNRTDRTAGASQYVDHFVKPGASYNITLQVYVNSSWGNTFRVKLCTKGTGSAQTSTSAVYFFGDSQWHNLTATLTAPSWSGELEYARLTIDTDYYLGSTNSFYIDNLDIRENSSGRFIFRSVLGPGVNTLYSGGPTNPQGLYWIDCSNNRLVIERSRIRGTLLIINPGSGSCIAHGPISWSPAQTGYPALLVAADTLTTADFAIEASNRVLSEQENGTNFNPPGASHTDLGEDADMNDSYQSEIRGLVVIGDDLTYANRPLIRGQVLVGDDIRNSSGELEVDFQPDSLLNPPPGFAAPYTYERRPDSVRKAVLP